MQDCVRTPHLFAVVVWRDGGVEWRAVCLVEAVHVSAALDDEPGDLQRGEEVVLTVLEKILQQISVSSLINL